MHYILQLIVLIKTQNNENFVFNEDESKTDVGSKRSLVRISRGQNKQKREGGVIEGERIGGVGKQKKGEDKDK